VSPRTISSISALFDRESKPESVLHRLPRSDVASSGGLISRQPQPAFPYFLHNLTASAANTSGFLQTPLSKILGNTHPSSTCTLLAEDFRSTLTVLRQLKTLRSELLEASSNI